MDLIGIENEAEFFPAGTLSDSLQDELREITSRWSRGKDVDNPVKRLTNCTEPYLASLRQIRNSNDDVRRKELRREATHALITALGYDYQRVSLHTALDGEPLVPVLSQVANVEGKVMAWLLEAPLEGLQDEATDPLGANFEIDQFLEDEQELAETERAIEDILADGVFSLRKSPRYVLVFGLSQIILVDQHKWPARCVLRFDLQEIFARQDTDTLAVMACLISREARVPQQGVPIADRLEEEAQRNANTVTTSLKRTIRDAIEILGQEVLDVTDGKYPSGPRRGVWIEGPELSLECLRYMYRLLFLFYAEANPRLNILDLKDPIYASGYSIEALRELESVRLRTPVEKTGTYLWESLMRTLTLLYEGNSTAMRLPAVKVSLLDSESTPILNAINLRNEAIQKVIKLLSLKQSRKGTARISYAKLGIGQLGAVYETLISFTGVVAKQDLIELRPQTGRGATAFEEEAEDADAENEDENVGSDAQLTEVLDEESISRKDKINLLAPSYFVSRSRADEFRPEEIVFDGTDARVYPKGTFIYRLAGRDREKSASYYTPEPLARLLVKHALMERCKELSADEILDLKILEPAMGSAAFLVETTNQLSDLYLERKQKEVGQTIPQDQIVIEKQKVRAFISDRNCFGVDLNPVAVELGAISLWLNSLHASEFSPWFGDQLHAGNSLIGARRASYAPSLMSAQKKGGLWFNEKPQEIGWKRILPEGHIWQFLLPAKDMAKFDTDKSISEFAGDAQQKIKDWRKGGFFDKLEAHEVKLLQKLSRIAEELFGIVAIDLTKSRMESNDAITLWPKQEMRGPTGRDFREKDWRNEKLTGADHASNTLPYKRLKTAMDAWCALWLWPLDKTSLLPSRAEFLQGMAMILEGGFTPDGSLAAPSMEEFADPAPDFFNALEQNGPTKNLFNAAKRKQNSLFRETDVDSLVLEVDWLGVAVEVAKRERFTHFDLIFADILKVRNGFDIIVGNPPWSRPGFNEKDVIGDIDPIFVIKNLSAAKTKTSRTDVLQTSANIKIYLDAFSSAKGAMNATGSEAMNPFAGCGQNNLYRCFIDLSFRQVSKNGIAALIHQDGHLTESKSGHFRSECYSRLTRRFHMRNELRAKMFSEVGNRVEFSLNLYKGERRSINFHNIAHCFLGSQIEECYNHDGTGLIPDIKTPGGSWDTRGHSKRIVIITSSTIETIHALTETDEVEVTEARFLQPYTEKILKVFHTIASTPSISDVIDNVCSNHLSSVQLPIENIIPGWQMSGIWHESGAQRDGIIRREIDFAKDIVQLILTGPMIYVGDPLYKTPREGCKSHKDYDLIDVSKIPADYLPRTNYAPNFTAGNYVSKLPKSSWDPRGSHVDGYRLAIRGMIALNGERSLISAVIPPRVAHINTIESINFFDVKNLLKVAACTFSIIYDFLIKALGVGFFSVGVFRNLPLVNPGDTAMHRCLRLSCVTTVYASLWEQEAVDLDPLPWHSADTRLSREGPVEGSAKWDRSSAFCTDFARRMALVEIDVLVAQAFGLTIDQLIDIYRIHFPVLQQNESATWYDQKGQIVWTCSKGLPGIGYLEDGKSPSRKRWEGVLESRITELECEAIVDFMPGGPQIVHRTFQGPFDTCNRIEDYKRAWAYFEEHKDQELAE
jgi:hypothetical protein